jgi:hypothetical protein
MPHCRHTVPVYLRVASGGGGESIILSVRGAESMMLSASAECMDTLRAGAESIILSAPCADSMILIALFCCVIAISAATTKKKPAILTITDYRLWSTAPQQRRRSVRRRREPSFATLQTYSSWGVNAAVPYGGCTLISLWLVGHWSLVGWSTITPIMSREKRGTIFRYDIVVGAQIMPQKCLCDRIEKDGWDGHQ